MMDEWKSNKMVRVHSGWDDNKIKVHLASPVGLAKVLVASFDL